LGCIHQGTGVATPVQSNTGDPAQDALNNLYSKTAVTVANAGSQVASWWSALSTFAISGVIGESRGLVTVYRAVGPAELAGISKTGSFTNLAGLEGKYFTTSAQAAASYARQAVQGFGDPAYTIIRSKVPQSVLNLPGISATVDRGIPAYVIPNQYLPGMKPSILNYSPIP